jgi:hypothetical protein
MAELTLHFETTQGTDMETAAVDLKNSLGSVAGVESADTTPQRFQAIGPAEILSVIAIATTVIQSTSTLLKAVGDLHDAWAKVAAKFPGLHKPTVEVGMKKVPIDQLTDKDVSELLKS